MSRHPSLVIPLPIYQPSVGVERYILYDVDTITWLRKELHILGVLIGSLPQIPSQNVFLGLPLELQPEEARLLVDKGLAFVADDLHGHQIELANTTGDAISAFRSRLQAEGLTLARKLQDDKKGQREKAMKKARDVGHQGGESAVRSDAKEDNAVCTNSDLFEDAQGRSTTSAVDSQSSPQSWVVTPATSTSITGRTIEPSEALPAVQAAAYALFRHLHDLGYFMTPGLRFGCQFSVYPGDPLRYHSHFLANGAGWDEEIDLVHLVGGGRLGTGVKKAWVVGGVDSSTHDEQVQSQGQDSANPKVRTFCIEWGGM